jgi:hypothetical protein
MSKPSKPTNKPMFMFMSSWVPTQVGWPIKETMPIDIIFINVSTTITVTSDRPIGLYFALLSLLNLQVRSGAVSFFNVGGQRLITRHKLNNRKQDTVLNSYVTSVKQRGIVKGVRGDCWLMADHEPKSDRFYALTWGTLNHGSIPGLNAGLKCRWFIEIVK